jgi:hypothetical protein
LKETKDLFNENCKALKREIEEDISDGNIFHTCGSVESTL